VIGFFTPFDRLQVERICGSKKADKMVSGFKDAFVISAE